MRRMGLKRQGRLAILILVTIFLISSMPVFARPVNIPEGQASRGYPTKTDHYMNRYIPVQILGINDFHGNLNGTRTDSKTGVKSGQADYLAAYLRQREATNKNTLIVHAGDVVGASPPVSALMQDEPTIEFLNMIGCDVGTIGNHEFDEGVDEMLRLINGGYHESTGFFAGASFPYVSANVVWKDSEKTVLPPYVVKKVNGMPIGFIGVTLTETPTIVIPSAVVDLKFLDEVEAINKAVVALKQKKVETIIVLAHVDGNATSTEQPDTLGYIAANIDDEVDVIISGHMHLNMKKVVDGKLIVQQHYGGYAFSDIDLLIDPLTKDVVEKKAEIVVTNQALIDPDPEITQFVKYYQDLVAPLVNRVIGESAVALTKTQNAAGESPLGNLIADAQKWRMGTDFALMNPGGIRADLDAGPVTWGELSEIQPFSNDLVKMTLTGADIRIILNQQFAAIPKMLQISGFKYTWQESPVKEVVDIFMADGVTPIDPAAHYTVTCNAFLAGGGDGFLGFLNGTGLVVGPTDLQGLVEYVQSIPQPFSAAIEGRIMIVE